MSATGPEDRWRGDLVCGVYEQLYELTEAAGEILYGRNLWSPLDTNDGLTQLGRETFRWTTLQLRFGSSLYSNCVHPLLDIGAQVALTKVSDARLESCYRRFGVAAGCADQQRA